MISLKLPKLKNLKKEIALLDREIAKAGERVYKVLDEFGKFSTSVEEMLLVRKY